MKEALSRVLSTWERLLAGVATHSEGLQCVEACRVQLARDLSEIRALQVRRAALREEMILSTRTLKMLLARGADLAARVRAGVKFRYGTRSEKLRKFGMKPLPRRRKPIGKEAP